MRGSKSKSSPFRRAIVGPNSEIDRCPSAGVGNHIKEIIIRFYKLLNSNREEIDLLCSPNVSFDYPYEMDCGVETIEAFYKKLPKVVHDFIHVDVMDLEDKTIFNQTGFIGIAVGYLKFEDETSDINFKQNFIIRDVDNILKITRSTFEYI